MRHIISATAGVAGVALLVVSSIALGSTGGQQTPSAAGSPISIVNRLSATMSADHTFKGKFLMEVDGVRYAGTATVSPNRAGGPNKIVGGQKQIPVRGHANLKSTKGTLSLVFRGVDIEVQNIDPAKNGFTVEYGTWQIQGATGIYNGWKGGGRWADASTPSAHNIEWDGFVTH
jgi:hypothetical protein